MGQLPERKQPFIGHLSSFHEAYPTGESATVRFTETDFGSDPKVRYWSLAEGPRIPCRNSACQRGDYDHEWLVGNIIASRVESKEISMSRNGDEGTPKGRRIGRSCDMSMEGTINVKYKSSAEPK